MKNRCLIALFLLSAMACLANTTIDPANKEVYGANVGWINAAADSTNGAVIGQAFCRGYMYSANAGWIHLGNGAPVNGVAYATDSATDYGINHDGLGNLTGYAYGANIGWITFEQTHGKPVVDLLTGELSGYAWGANIGWINLATLVTLSLAAPDSDVDGIADAWEYGHTNTLVTLSGGDVDADDDGVSDLDEYYADTDPFNSDDYLRITDFDVIGLATNDVTWIAKKTRLYTLQHTLALTNMTPWSMSSSPFIPSANGNVTETLFGVTDTNRFYRVQATPPLSP